MSRVPLNRVCIVMMSAVGDAVHVLPVLTALKRHHPTMHLTWVLQPGPAALVRGHQAVDAIILFDRMQGLAGFLDIRQRLQALEFDLVINLQVYFKAGMITGFTRAPVKLGFDRARARDANWLFTTHRIPPHPMQHVQDQYFEFCEWLGVPHGPVTWDLGPWNDAEREWQRAFFERVEKIVIARRQQLLDYFRDNGLRVVFTASGCFAEDCMDVSPHRAVRYRFRRQYAGSPEYEISEAVRPLPGEVVINKGTVSAFVSTGLDSMMRSWGAARRAFHRRADRCLRRWDRAPRSGSRLR